MNEGHELQRARPATRAGLWLAVTLTGLILSWPTAAASRGGSSNRSSAGGSSGNLVESDPRKAFEVVVVRNIFNPNRGYKPPPPKEERRDPPPPPTEKLALTGTLISEAGHYGFFDGSKSDYRMVAKLQQEIGGLKLAEVTTTHVRLQSGTNEFQLPIGSEMSRTGTNAWVLAGVRTSSSGESPASTSTSDGGTTSDSSASSSSAADRSAKLKELLARRKQATGK